MNDDLAESNLVPRTTEESSESEVTPLPSVSNVTTQKPNSTPEECQFDGTDKNGYDLPIASCKNKGSLHTSPI